jgi:hypothetical protein
MASTGTAGAWSKHATEALCARVGTYTVNYSDGVYLKTVDSVFRPDRWQATSGNWQVSDPGVDSSISARIDPLGTGVTVPPHIWQPMIIYLGRAA